jgi:hypothetical protein
MLAFSTEELSVVIPSVSDDGSVEEVAVKLL